MSEPKLHTCRVPRPCWGCGSEIGKGHKYCKLVTWEEFGPTRTVRLHPECHSIIRGFTQDEWDEFSPGDLDSYFEQREADKP